MRPVLTALAAVALLATAVSLPQDAVGAKDPCSSIRSKKDSFGVKETWEVSDYRFERSNGVSSLSFSAKKGGWFTAPSNTALPRGSVLEVIFTDGTTWSYATEVDVMPGSAVFPYVGLIVWWDVRVPLTSDAATVFGTKTVKAFRLSSGGNEFSKGQPSKGDAEKLRVMTACFAPPAAAAAVAEPLPAAVPAPEPAPAVDAGAAPAPAAAAAPATDPVAVPVEAAAPQ